MDQQHKKPLEGRPIILSPPPLENMGQMPIYPRQQSVGYNMQHEFENLTIDLDLDLSKDTAMNSSGSDNSIGVSKAANTVPSLSGIPTGLGTASANAAPPVSASSGDSGCASVSGSGSGSGGASSGLLHPIRSHGGAFSSDLIGSGPATPNPFSRDSILNSGHQHPHNHHHHSALLQHTIPTRPQSVDFFRTGALNSATLAPPPQQQLQSQQQQQQQQQQASQQQQNNYVNELLAFTNWIENLSPKEIITMIDHLTNHLPLDILLTFKSHLDTHLTGNSQSLLQQQQQQQQQQIPDQLVYLGQQQQQHQPQQQQQFSTYASPYQTQELYSDVVDPILAPSAKSSSNVNVNINVNNASANGYGHLQQPKPKVNYRYSGQYFNNMDSRTQRPRSADPTVRIGSGMTALPANYNTHAGSGTPPPVQYIPKQGGVQLATSNSGSSTIPSSNHERAISPASHLFEKTNFLQLAAANHNQGSKSPSIQIGGGHQDELDLSAHATALKLGALATINSRVALDSNRKNYSHSSQNTQGVSGTSSSTVAQILASPNNYVRGNYDDNSNININRTMNSSSVPPIGTNAILPSTSTTTSTIGGSSNNANNRNSMYHAKPSGGINAKQASNSASSIIGSGATSPNSSTSTVPSSMPTEVSSLELLNNIPAWLKLLRLHKYTDSLKDVLWRDLIELDDLQLEQRGVKALGARRKLLKAFDVVKANMP